MTRITLFILCCLGILGCVSSPLPYEEQVVFPTGNTDQTSGEYLHAVSQAQIQVEKLITEPLYPVKKRGKILLILHDQNKDSYPEVFVLCAKVSSPQLADYAFLADYARLKNKNHNVIMFYLLCFKNTLGQLSLNSTTEIGEKPVFRSFSLQTFIPSDPGHILLRLAFITAEGSDIEFYLQNSPDTAPRQIVSGQESTDSSIAVTDINDDGIADIILSHKQAEDGIGYETTMRWYRFNGKTYALFKTTSIVRNLKNFLGNIKTMLSGGQISRFVTYAVEPQSLKALREKGSSDSRIALRALNMDSLVSQSGLSVYNFMKRIKELVFPDILENPFISKSSLGRRFKLTFKIIDTDNIPFISESLLYLNKNPFGPHQFFFNP